MVLLDLWVYPIEFASGKLGQYPSEVRGVATIGRKVSVIVLMISVLYVGVFYVAFRVVTKDGMIENTISNNMDTMKNISNNIEIDVTTDC